MLNKGSYSYTIYCLKNYYYNTKLFFITGSWFRVPIRYFLYLLFYKNKGLSFKNFQKIKFNELKIIK